MRAVALLLALSTLAAAEGTLTCEVTDITPNGTSVALYCPEKSKFSPIRIMFVMSGASEQVPKELLNKRVLFAISEEKLGYIEFEGKCLLYVCKRKVISFRTLERTAFCREEESTQVCPTLAVTQTK